MAILLLVSLPHPLRSQTAKAQGTVRIQNVETFFSRVISLKTDPERREFETKEEFEKRLSKTVDTSIVYYIPLGTAGLISKSYTYDLESQVLEFHGGGNPDRRPTDYRGIEGDPILVRNVIENRGSYKGSNAYGASVTVKEVWSHDYVLNVNGLRSLPDSIYDYGTHTMKLALHRPPKEAERLSKTIKLAVGVKLWSANNSAMECVDVLRPKFDNPIDAGFFVHWVDARFVDIVLYDPLTKRVVTRFTP
ncbi:MAG TPA: hypothetical protein VGL38_09235 [bacterium]|jgi:hypothetical protein